MRFIKIEQLEESMILGQPVYDERYQVLQREKTFIDEDLIMQLKLMNYSGIYILDDFSKDVDFKELLKEEERVELRKRLDRVRMYPNDISYMASLDDYINILAGKIMQCSLEEIINLEDLYFRHEYNDTHCINVAILSGFIGRKLDFEFYLLKDLIKSAILHDMGRSTIPEEILQKPGKLSRQEFELVKQAPMAGYQRIANSTFLNSMVKTGLLQYHERYDGSGYPLGLKGEEISIFGRIIAIADVFDALISDRPFRSANTPIDAIRYLLEDRGQFDMNLVEDFLWCVVPFPNGACVKLSTGEDALVLHNYMEEPLRPRCKVIPSGKIIDLCQDKEYTKVQVLLQDLAF